MENLSNSEENKYTAKIFSYDNSDSPVSFDDERIILFYRFLNPKIDRFRLPKAHLIPLKQFVHDTLKYSIIIHEEGYIMNTVSNTTNMTIRIDKDLKKSVDSFA